MHFHRAVFIARVELVLNRVLRTRPVTSRVFSEACGINRVLTEMCEKLRL